MILGYIVNYQNFDAWKFISTMNKQRIEEADIDGSDVVSGSTILLETYSKLLCAIEANAKKIDSIYRDEGQNLRKFELKKLFQSIDPLIFNFIVFSTKSRRERNCIFQVIRSHNMQMVKFLVWKLITKKVKGAMHYL